MYQDGIVHLLIEEVGSPLKDFAFRASQHDGVEWAQLRKADLQIVDSEAMLTIRDKNVINEEQFEVVIDKSNFEVSVYAVGDERTLMTQLNPQGRTLLLENTKFYHSKFTDQQPEGQELKQDADDDEFTVEEMHALESLAETRPVDEYFEFLTNTQSVCKGFSNHTYEVTNKEKWNKDFKQSVSLGFYVPQKHLYGIPERAFDFRLPTTEKSGPYRLFNQDLFPHSCEAKTNLYGSIPYLTAHSALEGDSSIAWMNSGDTWVDILDYKTVMDSN